MEGPAPRGFEGAVKTLPRTHLHVLQDQHGVALVQALAKELDDVLVVAELVQDIDFTAERLEDGGAVVCNQLLDCHLCGAMPETLVDLQPDAWRERTANC